MNIYESIKELCRKNANLKVRELEKQLGFTENLLSKWAKASPTVNNLLKVADYFNVPLDYFVGRTVQQTSISNENGIVANGTVSNSGNNNNFSQNNNQYNNLSEIETELISTCRKMDTRKKTALLTYAYGLEKE